MKKSSTLTKSQGKAPISNPPTSIYQLKIELKDTKPSIWRRVLVSSDTLFADLHEIIQIVMGWENGHLYGFNVGDPRRGGVFIEGRQTPFGDLIENFSGDYDAEKVKISEFLVKKKDKVIYEYDFGDSWRHLVTLEKAIQLGEPEYSTPLPSCIGGERRCPPEDCGGVWGFADLQKALKDKAHPNHEDMIEWMGDEVIDWSYFSVEEANEVFRPSKKGRKVKN